VVKSDTMRCAIYVTPHTVPSSVANLLDVLHGANGHAGRVVFDTVLVAEHRGPFGRRGVKLVPQAWLGSASRADIVIAPAVSAPLLQLRRDCPRFIERLPGWLAAGRLAASACTGAFLLASAGVLNGRRATTHWSAEREFRSAFPDVRLRFASLIERDGPVITSGGGTAGIDLGLALVEQAAGGEVARRVAAGILFDYRRGPQGRYFPLTPAPSTGDSLVARAQASIHERLAEPLTIASLAQRLHVSTRTLLRRFRADLGLTPQAYLQRARIDVARARLEATEASIEQIVAEVGYVDRASFGRSFKRHLGVAPATFRRKVPGPRP